MESPALSELVTEPKYFNFIQVSVQFVRSWISSQQLVAVP